MGGGRDSAWLYLHNDVEMLNIDHFRKHFFFQFFVIPLFHREFEWCYIFFLSVDWDVRIDIVVFVNVHCIYFFSETQGSSQQNIEF